MSMGEGDLTSGLAGWLRRLGDFLMAFRDGIGRDAPARAAVCARARDLGEQAASSMQDAVAEFERAASEGSPLGASIQNAAREWDALESELTRRLSASKDEVTRAAGSLDKAARAESSVVYRTEGVRRDHDGKWTSCSREMTKAREDVRAVIRLSDQLKSIVQQVEAIERDEVWKGTKP